LLLRRHLPRRSRHPVRKPPANHRTFFRMEKPVPNKQTGSRPFSVMRLFKRSRKMDSTRLRKGAPARKKGCCSKGCSRRWIRRITTAWASWGARLPRPNSCCMLGSTIWRGRVMTMENCDAHYGPVISLNNYIPMDKYEISKSPTEEEVRKICAQIVANLKALLSVNSAAFSD